VAGTKSEFRRFSPLRIVADLKTLANRGASSVTFSDEDFLGGSVDGTLPLLAALEVAQTATDVPLRFDASVTVSSLASPKDGPAAAEAKLALFERFRKCGLRKIFLGIESGSASQLKRYAKGHTPEHITKAVRLLEASGVSIELGWILFDPLCTRDEVIENLEFLLNHNLAKYTSYIFNELRLQPGTPYFRLLETFYKRTGKKLWSNELDPDTLSHPYVYSEPDTSAIVHAVQMWTSKLRPLQYPLKSLSRYGSEGGLGSAVAAGRALLESLRSELCGFLHATIKAGSIGTRDGEIAFQQLSSSFAARIRVLVDGMEAAQREHPIVKVLDRAAMADG
jgi:radical SAM superfamily enzyme YgiQ (UPF0313 family)